MLRSFFLLIHFLLLEDYELPKSTSHILSVPLTLECVRILSWPISFFFYFNCFPDVILCEIAIWANDTALNSSFDKESDKESATSWNGLWVLNWSKKYENVVPKTSENAILHPIIYLYMGNYSIFMS